MSNALRYNQGKPELSYILTWPNALSALAEVCMYGAQKYDRGNYLKGAKYSQYMDCMLRHLSAWNNGEELDQESGCHHLSHVVWNALCLSEMAATRPDLDDRINQESVQGNAYEVLP